MYSDLHSKRDDSDHYHWSYDGGHKQPIIEAYYGKNKVSSFKGTLWLKSWPDKAFFVEMTEQAMKDLTMANQADRQQAAIDNDAGGYKPDD